MDPMGRETRETHLSVTGKVWENSPKKTEKEKHLHIKLEAFWGQWAWASCVCTGKGDCVVSAWVWAKNNEMVRAKWSLCLWSPGTEFWHSPKISSVFNINPILNSCERWCWTTKIPPWMSRSFMAAKCPCLIVTCSSHHAVGRINCKAYLSCIVYACIYKIYRI